MTKPATKCAVFLSGSGRTLDNFYAHIQAGTLNLDIRLAIASKTCKGIDKAKMYGVGDVRLLKSKDHLSTSDYSEALFSACREHEVELVLLAGFLSLIHVPDDFQSKVINIHPSLIPAFAGHGFYGHHVHEAVVARGCKISGCTVHFCDNHYDHGPIILQQAVEITATDTPDEVAAKVFQAECQAYPQAIRLFTEGRLNVVGGKVHVRDA